MRIVLSELLEALDEVDKAFMDLQRLPLVVVSREAIEFSKCVELAKLKLGVIRHNLTLAAKQEFEEWSRLDDECEMREDRKLFELDKESQKSEDEVMQMLNDRRSRLAELSDDRDQT